jgi:hypothetical protein
MSATLLFADAKRETAMYNLHSSPEQFRASLLKALLAEAPLADAGGARMGASSQEALRRLAETLNRLSDPYGASPAPVEGGACPPRPARYVEAEEIQFLLQEYAYDDGAL